MRQPKVFRTDEKRLEPIKLYLCYAISKVCTRNQWTQRQAAIYMGTSQGNVSRVCGLKTGELSVGQLFHYLARICPRFSFMLSVDNTVLPDTYAGGCSGCISRTRGEEG